MNTSVFRTLFCFILFQYSLFAYSQCDDLGVVFQSKTAKIINNFSNKTEIKMDFKVTNLGRTTFSNQIVQVRAFLIPVNNPPVGGQFKKDGIALESVDYKWSLSPFQSATETYQVFLPKVPKDEYYAVVYIDSDDQLVDECNEFNNTTWDVIPVGQKTDNRCPNTSVPCVESTADRTNPNSTIDWYSEIRRPINTSLGGLNHQLATIRFDKDPKNRISVKSRDLWAAFFVFDPKNKKFYPVQYKSNSGMFTKQFFALQQITERRISDNALVAVDNYYQEPGYARQVGKFPGLAPGDYWFLTLSNSKNLIPEIDYSNNLDAHPFTLAPVQYVERPNNWIVNRDGEKIDPKTPARVWKIKNMVQETLSLSLSFESMVQQSGPVPSLVCSGTKISTPPWVDDSKIQLGYLQASATAQIPIYVDPSKAVQKRSAVCLVITATGTSPGYDKVPLKFPLRFSDFGNGGPEVSISQKYFYFKQVGLNHAGQIKFKIKSEGDNVMFEFWPKDPWLTYDPPEGVLKDGIEQEITVISHNTITNKVGVYETTADLFTCATNDPTLLRSTVKLGIMSPQAPFTLGKVILHGKGCGGSSTTTQPTLDPSHATIGGTLYPTPNTYQKIGGHNAPPSTVGQLFLGDASSDIDLGNDCKLLIAGSSLIPLGAIQSDAQGNWSFGLKIPNDQKLLGQKAFLQAAFPANGKWYLTNSAELVLEKSDEFISKVVFEDLMVRFFCSSDFCWRAVRVKRAKVFLCGYVS